MKATTFWRKAHRLACYVCVLPNKLRTYCAMRRDLADGIAWGSEGHTPPVRAGRRSLAN